MMALDDVEPALVELHERVLRSVVEAEGIVASQLGEVAVARRVQATEQVTDLSGARQGVEVDLAAGTAGEHGVPRQLVDEASRGTSADEAGGRHEPP